jgi:hypothetical protein
MDRGYRSLRSLNPRLFSLHRAAVPAVLYWTVLAAEACYLPRKKPTQE